MLACAYAAFGLEISPVLEGKMAAFSFTYDDGARCHYTHALPMHLKYGMPATFFIITDRVEPEGEGRAKKYCSWPEIKEMSDKGMEMASHTKSHPNMRELESAGLTKEMMKGKTRDELFAMREPNWPKVWSEVALSREALESHTGQKVRCLAYPGNAFPDWTGRINAEGRLYTRGEIKVWTGRTDTEEGYRKRIDEHVMAKNSVSCCIIHGVGSGDSGDGWNPIPSLAVYESLFKLARRGQAGRIPPCLRRKAEGHLRAGRNLAPPCAGREGRGQREASGAECAERSPRAHRRHDSRPLTACQRGRGETPHLLGFCVSATRLGDYYRNIAI